jgi:hypothetical protein
LYAETDQGFAFSRRQKTLEMHNGRVRRKQCRAWNSIGDVSDGSVDAEGNGNRSACRESLWLF